MTWIAFDFLLRVLCIFLLLIAGYCVYPKKMFIVRGLTADGIEVFYTGCAGPKFISKLRTESFVYVSQHCARERAKNLNCMTPLHGVWFIAIPFNEKEDN